METGFVHHLPNGKTSCMPVIISRVHPLIVHLPIGLMLFALLITLLPAHRRQQMRSALTLLLAVASLSSIAACVSGYLLSRSGEYDLSVVGRHQWLGITACILTLAAWQLHAHRRWLVWLAATVISVGGHFGGVLTHGEGYLFSGNPEPEATILSGLPVSDSAVSVRSDSSQPLGQPRQVFLYRDDIVPILRSRCYSCHSATKLKGGLRLDSEAMIKKGGKTGRIFLPGDASGSILYTHLILPVGDEKHMPPEGRKQLTASEIGRIHDWIMRGAPFGPLEIPQGSVALEAVKRSIVPLQESVVETEPEPDPILPAGTRLPAIPAADPGISEALNRQDVIVQPVAEGANGLSVNFVNRRTVNPDILSQLNGIAAQVVELRLSGLDLTDEQFARLESMPHLRRLMIDRTKITDAGLSDMKRFPALESLNLYGTAVTDKGIGQLTGCHQLKHLYLWQTKVSDDGIRSLKARNPAIKTDAGNLVLKKPDSIKTQ